MEKNPKILVVDDDPDFVVATSAVLKSKAYQVVVARDGEEGIRKMKEERPDLVLLDILMPGKDGFVAADEISHDPAISSIPVLALTSFSESLGQPFPFKVTGYLQKTISADDLLQKVAEHTGKRGSRA